MKQRLSIFLLTIFVPFLYVSATNSFCTFKVIPTPLKASDLSFSSKRACSAIELSYRMAILDRMRSYKQSLFIGYTNHSEYIKQSDELFTYNQKYTLAEHTKTYLKQTDLSKKIWTKSFYGTKQQHQLHTSFITLTNRAALKIYAQPHAHDLYKSVIDHAAAGCVATRENNLDLAHSLYRFCTALFDCAELVVSATFDGAKSAVAPIIHPIQTSQELACAIVCVAECTVDLIERAIALASVRTQTDFEHWKQKQAHDIQNLYIILCDEYAQITPRSIIKKIISSLAHSLVSANLFGALAHFTKTLKNAKSRLPELIARTKHSKEYLVASTAEGIPVSISQKISEFFKAESTASSRFKCACSATRSAHIHPHGIYQDAPYHKKIGNWLKSASPLDGQLALDHSIPLSENSIRRIGISRGQFVMLGRTEEGLYHGHVVNWKELSSKLRNELEKLNFTNSKGKILRKDLL